ncbi:hypothetical protein ABEB36_003538 [Hypothenemus hampei]|uniref:Uncharacterized protein n=1 Tax=Hypothenemus hampei TaxID=57062 RepID=A0ABD1F9J6_HYPHA
MGFQKLFVYLQFFMVFQLVLCQNDSELPQLQSIFQQKCLKNTGKTESYDKLSTDVSNLYRDFQNAIEYLQNDNKLFCNNQRKLLIETAHKVKSDLKTCLPDSEKFLAKFFLHSFEELLHFLCHKNGIYSARFFSNEGQQCRQALEKSQANDVDNCLNRIFAPTKGYITQTELCDDIIVAKKCFSRLLDTFCPSANNFKNLNDIFFNYISNPCSNAFSLLSTNKYLLLLVIMFIHILKSSIL